MDAVQSSAASNRLRQCRPHLNDNNAYAPIPVLNRRLPLGFGRLLSAVLLACVFVTVMTSQANAARTSGLRHVVVVGDSITALAAGSIHGALDSRYQDVLVYQYGRTIDQMLPGLKLELAKHKPVFAVVENLGTNDALQGGRHPDWQSSWTQLLKSTAHVPCVVLTTINPISDLYGKQLVASRQLVASEINLKIRTLAKSNPARYKIVDWNALVTELLHENATLYRYLQLDAIHEKPAGAEWIAAEDRAALSDCGSPVEPSVIPPK